MTYVLNSPFRLRGWKDRLGGIYYTEKRRVSFIGKENYLLLMKQQKSQTKRMKASPFLLERCSNYFVTFKVT